MSALSEDQVWDRFHGEAVAIVLLGEDTTNPGSLTLKTYFTVPGATSPTLTVTPTVSGPDGSGFYTITTTLTRAQTLDAARGGAVLTGNRYRVDVWDAGNDRAFATGTLILDTPARGSS